MDPEQQDELLLPSLIHPLKLFDIARAQGRLLYASAPMVRYSKLAFRQTVHYFGTDLCWTPMILAKEFNRSSVARDSDLTIASWPPSPAGGVSAAAVGGDGTPSPHSLAPWSQPPTIAQFGANSPLELSRAASLAAPFVNGVDINCGCPQSWACAATLGAALMDRRELVRDMVVATRERLARDGWAVDHPAPYRPSAVGSHAGGDPDGGDDPLGPGRGRGRSISVKIRVHADLRRTLDFVTAVVGDPLRRNVDFITVHPRTRRTPSSAPVDLEALAVLTSTFGPQLPVVVSGDVFAPLSALPYTTFSSAPPVVPPHPAASGAETSSLREQAGEAKPHLPHLAGLMSARALLANPALFAGADACPWSAVDVFLANVARAPLPLKLAVHHLTEMCGPGYYHRPRPPQNARRPPARSRTSPQAPDDGGVEGGSTNGGVAEGEDEDEDGEAGAGRDDPEVAGARGPRPALLSKKERAHLTGLRSWIDVLDYVDEARRQRDPGSGGVVRYA
ncbi:FMN-linked oxidoreductase [Durotheca rogersii]|uniref:FMN-linked oxidoreductase n=1 Tax=Durotheca rogersii TaxID=419775 RepID=UPI0022207A5B|nr:FMN-linked oxidoreductase [Durotheca rogersii]KAI5862597.1 FMN-linked oxidoreductase [Durotheca rogersii]